MKLRAHKNNAAFTLIELLVAMGIGMALMAAVATTFITQTKYLNAQEQINEMQQNARAAIDLMAREIKMAGYNPSGASFTGMDLDSTKIRIRADLDGDGNPSGGDEDITYEFDNSNKLITRNTVALAENIDSFTFSYHKADGSTAAVASDIRQLRLNITAKTAKPDPNYSQNNGYRTYQLTAWVTPPNLGY